jgi:hypothetical protein
MEQGAIRTGFVSREVPDLTSNTGSDAVKLHARRLPVVGNTPAAIGRSAPGRFAKEGKRKLSRAFQNREDFVRLASYIEGRRRGLSPENAAREAMRFHFDYADLTELERNVFRRAMPFYTWTARNIPLQFRMLLKRPGKFANYEKARQHAAAAAGLPPDWEENLSEFDQRQLVWPAKVNGHVYLLNLSAPVTDLNELPGFLGPSAQLDEWANKFGSLLTPMVKVPTELFLNRSFFTRADIQQETNPLTAAPPWAKYLPDFVKKLADVTDTYVDQRTGERSMGWSDKANYVARLMGAIPNIVSGLATPGRDSRGRGRFEKTATSLGLSTTPMDKAYVLTNRINELYDEMDEVDTKLAALRQQQHPKNKRTISADNSTPEYRALLARRRQINFDLWRASKQRGDKVPLGQKPAQEDTSFGGSGRGGFGAGGGTGGFGSSSVGRTGFGS